MRTVEDSQYIQQLEHIQCAAEDFVHNVTNQLVEGAGEMLVKTDLSFRELVKALNRDRKCESCGKACDCSDSKTTQGVIVCDECTRFGRFAHSSFRLEELESKMELVVSLLNKLSESPIDAIEAIKKALGK